MNNFIQNKLTISSRYWNISVQSYVLSQNIDYFFTENATSAIFVCVQLLLFTFKEFIYSTGHDECHETRIDYQINL